MSMDREKLYEYSVKRLLGLVYNRLDKSRHINTEWREEAALTLDAVREELISWLVESQKAMNRARERERRERKVLSMEGKVMQREEVDGDV